MLPAPTSGPPFMHETRVPLASLALTREEDVPGAAQEVNNVVNYDAPMYAKTYVHRVGRTARAGATGRAFTLLCPQEVRLLPPPHLPLPPPPKPHESRSPGSHGFQHRRNDSLLAPLPSFSSSVSDTAAAPLHPLGNEGRSLTCLPCSSSA